jgi:hypothetical protein
LSGCGRSSTGRANKSGRSAAIRVDSVLVDASLLNMNTPNNPDSPVKCGENYDEWFLHEVDKGIAAADRGKLVDHSDVRKLIDERYPR